jgi:translocator protein
MVIPDWMRAGLAILTTFAAAALCMFFMGQHTIEWYAALNKPVVFSLSLTSIVFIGIVTYGLLSIGASLIWIHDPRPHDFRGWIALFFVHLLMNMGWVILFFGYNVVFVSLVVAFFLAMFVFLLVCEAWNRSSLAFYMILIYFAWVLYALGMNIAVWMLN